MTTAANRIKEILKRMALHSGFVVHRSNHRELSSRCSLAGAMRTARRIGFIPGTIIDIGAARGGWSEEVSSIWPEARYILIDPLEENRQELERICRKLRNADYRIEAIADHSGNIRMNIHPDLEGSSLFLEREDNINGVPRDVCSITLDDLHAEMRFEFPVLLKADVQGAEMKVLTGAARSLTSLDMIVLEILLFDIYQGENAQLFDMLSYLKSNGFVAWDIFGMGYRLLDEALCQVDMVFVREDGLFRRYHHYATGKQREDQLAAIKKNNPKRFKQ